MSQLIEFTVYGKPVAQPRPRATGIVGKPRFYNPSTARDWKAIVAMTAQAEMTRKQLPPFKGPVRVSCLFYMPRPKSHFRTGSLSELLKPDAPVWHSQKPDRDNLDKAVLDALTKAKVFRDDCQVVDGNISKVWSRAHCAGVAIKIEEL